MPWQLLVLISVTTYAASITLQRIILKDDKSDAVAYSILFQILTGFIIFVYAVLNGFQMPNILNYPLQYILMTALYAFGNVMIFKSLQSIPASQFTILFATRAFWTILVAMLFLNESFSLIHGIGTLLIIAAVVLASWQGHKLSFSKGEIYALLAAISFGIAFANDAYIIQNEDVPSYLAVAFVLPGLAIIATRLNALTKMKQLINISFLKKMTLIGVLYAISAIAIFQAYQVGRNAAQIAPLNQTSTLLTVLFGIIVLKERDNLLKKIAASIIAFIGIILLI